MKVKNRGLNVIGYIFVHAVILILSCLSATIFMVSRWAKSTFNVSLNAIINTLTSPLQGTSSDTIVPAVKYCLPVVLTVLLLCVAYIVWDVKRNQKGVRILVLFFSITSLIAAVGYVQYVYDVLGYIRYMNEETTLYEEYYVEPKEVVIQEPEEKRNLIYIYLESMETTYADKENGGKQEINYIPYATSLAKENVYFSNTEKLGGIYPANGATWTMGAIFSSTAGLPFAFPVGTTGMENEKVFASGVYSLGDFLEEQGYVQEFLCGSDAVFAGRKNYLEQHGNYKIFDLYTAREKGYIPENYFEWWGFEDKILYEIAKDEILRLSEGEEPFNFTMLTVDAHHIGGYLCSLCDEEYDNITANVVRCGDKLLENFIEWCKKQHFYENTTIVIVGDHPRMDNNLVECVEYSERTLYNCFLNTVFEERERVQRESTLMDMFPTVLTALGYKIDGNKLGLGVNLFSKEPTLVERFGLQTLNEEFAKSSTYYVKRFAPELFYLVEDEEMPICTINFGEDDYNALDYVKEGITEPEGIYSWVEGKEMPVSIPIKDDLEKVSVTIHVVGSVREEYYGIIQKEQVILDGIIKDTGNIKFDAMVENGKCEFTLRIPLVESPFAYGISDDKRAISFKISHITVNLCEQTKGEN